MREFARQHGIENCFEIGRIGIEHVILPEMGLVAPGDVVIGADSHTCTYGALAAFSTGVGSHRLRRRHGLGPRVAARARDVKFVYRGAPGQATWSARTSCCTRSA